MLLKPKIKLDKITDISIELLKKYNITTLILDVDNTMSTHHGQKPTAGLSDWIDSMHKNSIKLTILSNSNNKRIAPFAAKVDLPYLSMGLKPLPFGFIRAAKSMNTKLKNAAIVGDQIFTDILGGNLTGVKTILLTPIKPETSLRFRLKRKLEKVVYKIYKINNTEV